MSDAPPHFTHPVRRLTLHLVSAVAIALAVAGGLGLLYVLAPEPTEPWTLLHFALFGAVCLTAFVAVTVGAVRRLSKSPRPFVTGVIFVVMMSTILILSYSWLYLSMSNLDPTSFTEPLTKSSAVYFTVTVLSTVGFGDITATVDSSRLVVTSQMVVGFTVITVAIRAVVSTTSTAVKVKHGRAAQGGGPEDHASREA